MKKSSTNADKTKASKIINILLWVVLFAWMAICVTDFILVKSEKEPIFCLSKTVEYDDGTVKSCLGLGYKVYNYQRDSYKGLEFGPMWGKDRSESSEK